MFTHLFKYAAKADDEALAQLNVEDVALCAAWYESLEPEARKAEPFASLPAKIESWLGQAHEMGKPTEGRRAQPLLRQILYKLRLAAIHMHRNELDVLEAVFDLAHRATDPKPFERLLSVFEEFYLAVKECRDEVEPTNGLQSLENRLHIVTSTVLEQARRRKIRSFAGVYLPGQGKVFTHSGNVKVIDHVPDECMLVVEDGACYVNGYMLGRVAASQHCEVHENVSGVIVVRQGEIRARNAINNALLLSKQGPIFLHGTERPRLIFAGERLTVTGNTLMGMYASPDIHIEGEAVGGEFCVSSNLTCGLFKRTHEFRSRIALQRRVSCEDYGEIISPEATRLLAKVAKRRLYRKSTDTMLMLAANESEHYSASTIKFLMGGTRAQSDFDALNSAQRRLAFLNRVIASADALVMSVDDQLAQACRQVNGTDSAATFDAGSSIEDMIADMSFLQEEEFDAELASKQEELVSISKELQQNGKESAIKTQSLTRLREKKLDWLNERDKLADHVLRAEKQIQTAAGNAELLQLDNAKVSNIQILKRLMARAQSRPFDDPLHKRAGTNFVKVMLRSIETRLERMRSYKKTLAEVEKEIKEQNETLYQEHNIRPPADEEEIQLTPKVVAKFGTGIAISTERYLLGKSGGPTGASIVTMDSQGEPTTYIRNENRIEETVA